MRNETRQNVVYWLSIITFIISTLMLFGFIAAQTYVRWKINQNFSFLGGFELEALTFLVLGQITALAYIHRAER
ncbi:hypothetical protein A3C86_02030 [Candidatus Kaiserbacteria bacterium RIFCSPHIGHO2_02_FULL_49_16]|uniref:DUF5671 domain-containing protein n=1 Tax=Candidatus Kaiserbacteria bacterium RIFCSPHIGHO2_02_FULL_49_16 TaxID=1798490 RepID=A0A1F6DBD0_9BACT|nr:MAG: hypothetical protein A3C86_02030 [Candidatus Kaiserbacteria bacterium RIFCSPHIGHO2_02_FULL_49_16]